MNNTTVCDKYDFMPKYQCKYFWFAKFWRKQKQINLGFSILENTNTNIVGLNLLDKYKYIWVYQK